MLRFPIFFALLASVYSVPIKLACPSNKICRGHFKYVTCEVHPRSIFISQKQYRCETGTRCMPTLGCVSPTDYKKHLYVKLYNRLQNMHQADGKSLQMTQDEFVERMLKMGKAGIPAPVTIQPPTTEPPRVTQTYEEPNINDRKESRPDENEAVDTRDNQDQPKAKKQEEPRPEEQKTLDGENEQEEPNNAAQNNEHHKIYQEPTIAKQADEDFNYDDQEDRRPHEQPSDKEAVDQKRELNTRYQKPTKVAQNYEDANVNYQDELVPEEQKIIDREDSQDEQNHQTNYQEPEGSQEEFPGAQPRNFGYMNYQLNGQGSGTFAGKDVIVN